MSLGHGTSIVRSGLVLHLDAANPKSYSGSGTAWNDLSGNGNNATLSGTSYNTNGKGAINCSAGSETIVVANSTSLQSAFSTESYTISTIVKSTDVVYPRSRHPLWIENAAPTTTTKGFTVGEGATSTSITIELSDGTNYVTQSLSSTIAESTTYFRSFVVNRGSTITYYINSVLVGSVNISTVTGSTYSSGGLQFGNVQGWRFIGDVYNISAYNRALTALEIQQNFEALRGRYNI